MPSQPNLAHAAAWPRPLLASWLLAVAHEWAASQHNLCLLNKHAQRFFDVITSMTQAYKKGVDKPYN